MKLFTLLMLSVPLALAMGCGAGSDDAAKDSAACKMAGGCGGADGGGSQSGALVLAKAPDGFVGDFYFGKDLICKSAKSCEASITGLITIEFKCPKHLFLPKTISVDGKDVQIVWDKPGDWGLAPQGTYRDVADQYEGEATTKLVYDHIELHWDGNVLGTVKGNVFSNIDGAIEFSNGVISNDLKKITYHAFNGEKQWDAVLTLVE